MPENPGQLETTGNLNANKGAINANRRAPTVGLTKRPLHTASFTVVQSGDGAEDTIRPYVLEHAVDENGELRYNEDGSPVTVQVYLTAAAVPHTTDEAGTAAAAVAAINAIHHQHGYLAELDTATVEVTRGGTSTYGPFSPVPVLFVDVANDAEVSITDFAEAEVELTAGTAGAPPAEFNVGADGTPVAAANEEFDTSLAQTAENFAASINTEGVLRARYPGSGASLFLQRLLPGPGPELVSVEVEDAAINGGEDPTWTGDEPPTAAVVVNGGADEFLADTFYALGFDPSLTPRVPAGTRHTKLNLLCDQAGELFDGGLHPAGKPITADEPFGHPWIDEDVLFIRMAANTVPIYDVPVI